MKMLWCWRCKMEMPMLNENEWEGPTLFGKKVLGVKEPVSMNDFNRCEIITSK